MRTAAENRDLGLHARGKHRAGQCADAIIVDPRADMLAQHHIRLHDLLRQTRLRHIHRARAGFLARLEQGDKGARPQVLMLRQRLRRTQQSSRVHVVATRVHPVQRRVRRVLQAGRLTDWQGIEIRAEAHHRTLAVFQHADLARLAHRRDGVTDRGEYLLNALRGSKLLHRQLRVPVEPLVKVFALVACLVDRVLETSEASSEFR